MKAKRNPKAKKATKTKTGKPCDCGICKGRYTPKGWA